jgi:reactive chlorine resistance protein C
MQLCPKDRQELKMSVISAPTTVQPFAIPKQFTAAVGTQLQGLGTAVSRYGLVVILLGIGAMKFSEYEATGIKGFVENSPLMAWTYSVFSVSMLSALLGVVEIVIGVMIAARRWSPTVSAVGSLLASGMFLTTLTFLASTPGVWLPGSVGLPLLSITGQFLLKDLALLGVAVWTAGEAAKAAAA